MRNLNFEGLNESRLLKKCYVFVREETVEIVGGRGGD